MPKLNQVKERYIYLSPTVQAGWEDESNINDFDGQKVLGRGAFGKVIRVLHRKSQLIYAIKEINKKNLKLNNMVEQVTNEVKIMYSLNHPYILKLYNHFEDESNIYLVLEYAQGGQLYVQLWKQPNHQFEEKKVAKYIFQLCKALEVCHSKGIIHRDIKPENILLDKDGNVKLADFGWSNFKQRESDIRTTFCGTLDYLAPEMLQTNHQHDFGVDIWSVGVLAYELLSGASPFAPKNNQNNADYVENTTKQNIKNLRYEFPKNFPVMAKDLISKILVFDPKQRLPLKEILAHPWIQTNCQNENIHLFETIDSAKEVKKGKLTDEAGQEVKTVFTNEEIYKYSRPDSIINKEYDDSFVKKENFQGSSKNISNASFIQNANSGDFNKKIIDQLQTQIKKLQSDYQAAELEKQKKNKEVESLKQQLNYMNNSNQSGMDSKMLEKLKEKDEKYNLLKKEYDYIKEKFTEQEKIIEKLQKSSQQSTQYQGNSDEVDRLKDENLFLRAQNDQFKTQLNQQKSVSDRKSPIEDMMQRISEYREKYEKMKDELLKCQQELIKLQSQKSGNLQSSITSNSSSQQLGDLDVYLEELKQKQLKQLNEVTKKK
ncbi:hypothetical protein ABPG72_001008 [Tetrahymena utriculariae]